jgi:prophage regulatory protein
MSDRGMMDEDEGGRLLRGPEVEERLGVSRTTLWRMIHAGIVPPPLALGRKINRWRLADVNEAIDRLDRLRPQRPKEPPSPPVVRLVRPVAPKLRRGPKAGGRHA